MALPVPSDNSGLSLPIYQNTERWPAVDMPLALPSSRYQGKAMSSLIRILTASLILTATCKADELKQPTVNVSVQYLEVTDAYQKLKASFTDIGKIVKNIQIDKNAFTLHSDHARYAEVRQMLTQMDVRPTPVLLDMVITEIKKDGTERVVGHPTCLTHEGQPCDVFYTIDQGRKLKLTIRSASKPEELAASQALRGR
jgi:hypothetical protein